MQPEPVDVSRSHWPLSTCKIVWKDAARISELRMRTGDAADYDAILQDEEAVARGVVRRRYLSGSDVERAKDVLRKARQKAFAVQAVSYTHLDVYKRQGSCKRTPDECAGGAN